MPVSKIYTPQRTLYERPSAVSLAKPKAYERPSAVTLAKPKPIPQVRPVSPIEDHSSALANIIKEQEAVRL